MRLSKTTNHAIRVLIDCAQSEDRLIKVAEISERLGITPQNTFKIVHLLSRAGFIEAVRGRRGGVKLAQPATEIHMGQVIRAVEASIATTSPTAKESGKHLGQIVNNALDAFTGVLDEYTIADMTAAATKRAKPRSEKTKKKPSTRNARTVASKTVRQRNAAV